MKYRFFAILCIFFLLSGFAAAEEVIHIIKKGETIYSIALSYGVKPDEVLILNNINDSRTVQAGQKIRIPGAVGNIAGGIVSGYDEYRVEKDETLYSLARRFGITLAELQDMNGFVPGYTLKAGEKILVPSLSGKVTETKSAAIAVKPAATTVKPASRDTAAITNTNKGSASVNVPKTPTNIEKANVSWPVKARDVSYLTGGLYGVQITGEQREPVKSLTRGTVVSTGPFRGFGNVAIIQKPDGYLYVYGGCETLSVKEGDKVTPGTELGKLGIDAKTAKPQLFFLVYMGNTPVDPAKAPRA